MLTTKQETIPIQVKSNELVNELKKNLDKKWETFYNQVHRKYYYRNKITGETSLENPAREGTALFGSKKKRSLKIKKKK